MTATPGATKRLGTAGNADNAPIAPKGTHKADALTTATNSSVGPSGGQITKSGDFNANHAKMDLRGGTEVITLSSFTGTDSFTITFQEADGTKVTTAAIVRGTNAAASDVQTAVRAALTGTDLTVVAGTTDEGPYTLTYDRFFQGRRFPKIVAITGTGCTGAVSRVNTPAVRLGGGHLGESLFDGDGVGPGHALTGPATTSTPSSGTNEVQTLTPGSGVDGGSVVLQFRRERSSALAFDASIATIQAELDAMFARMGAFISPASGTDSPVVTMTGTEVLTLDFGDMSTADTTKLTYNSVESTSTLTYNAALTVGDVQTLLDQIGLTSAVCTLARTSNLVYTITKKSAGAFASTVTCTTVSGFTPLGSGGYTLGGKVTTAWSASAGQTLWVFTFSRGYFKGRPVRGGFRVLDNLGAGSFTDGGVADTAAITVTTPGVLGSISVAYTELATYGDSVLITATNNTTGIEYSGVAGAAAALDAATPLVISGTGPGVYTIAARTYDTESQRVGPVAAALEQVTVV